MVESNAVLCPTFWSHPAFVSGYDIATVTSTGGRRRMTVTEVYFSGPSRLGFRVRSVSLLPLARGGPSFSGEPLGRYAQSVSCPMPSLASPPKDRGACLLCI